MKPIKSLILLLLIFSRLTQLFAQNELDIKVKKASVPDFSYQGRPVSPIALINIFPIEAGDEAKQDTVDLKKFPFPKRTYIDSNRPGISTNRLILYRTGFRYGADYTMQYSLDNSEAGLGGEVVAYEVLGHTKGRKFIVHGYLNTEGSLTQEFVFILDIKGDRLIKSGVFSCEVRYNQENMRLPTPPIIIKDDKIINGAVEYTIPASAL